MKKFPINKVEVDVEALGGAITLTELTQVYRVECNNDSEFDTPVNALLNAGLTFDQISLLGEQVIVGLYNEVIDLTYPNARKELQQQISSGEYKPSTPDEELNAKKNY